MTKHSARPRHRPCSLRCGRMRAAHGGDALRGAGGAGGGADLARAAPPTSTCPPCPRSRVPCRPTAPACSSPGVGTCSASAPGSCSSARSPDRCGRRPVMLWACWCSCSPRWSVRVRRNRSPCWWARAWCRPSAPARGRCSAVPWCATYGPPIGARTLASVHRHRARTAARAAVRRLAHRRLGLARDLRRARDLRHGPDARRGDALLKETNRHPDADAMRPARMLANYRTRCSPTRLPVRYC